MIDDGNEDMGLNLGDDEMTRLEAANQEWIQKALKTDPTADPQKESKED